MLRIERFTIMCSTLLTAVLLTGAVYADGIPKEIYQKIENNYSDALCKISYAIEITNPNSGETDRRSSYTLGIIVSEDGLVLVHGHMQLENRKPLNIKVTVGSGTAEKEYDAELLTKPEDINVTFLQLKNDENVKFSHLDFDVQSKLELGDPFLITGLLNPNFDYARAIQLHRVGAVLTDPRLTYAVDDSVGFGFIGSPVFNASGSPVGVIGFDLSSNEGGEIYTRSGYPLVYQAPLFQKYIDTPPGLEANEADASTAYLGIYTQPLTEEYAEYWNLPDEGGVIVSTVIGGSPAYNAGFKSGDVIHNFNGTSVTAKQDQDVVTFTKMVRESPIDQPLPVQFYRDGQPLEIKLTLTSRPTLGQNADTFEDTVFGITARELTTDVRIQLNLGDEVQGVIIGAVKSGSPASIARLQRNFVIQAIGDVRVSNLAEFQAVVTELAQIKPQEVSVFCRIGANTAFFRMKPRWDK